MAFYVSDERRKCPGAELGSCGRPATHSVNRSGTDRRGTYCLRCANAVAKRMNKDEERRSMITLAQTADD